MAKKVEKKTESNKVEVKEAKKEAVGKFGKKEGEFKPKFKVPEGKK